MMAMTMNNWVNDGNGYVGSLDLKPEVAHTVSLTADWHDAARSVWGMRLTPYYSLVENYIDATCATSVRACVPGQYNYLRLVNQDARIYGLDLSGFAALGQFAGLGSFSLRGHLSYVNGKNRDSGEHLYNMMPLNARIALEQKLGGWTNTLESQLVSAKEDVSRVRGEVKTPGYGLLNLRSSYEWKNVRVDFGIENLLDKFYYHPLGGAYIGQGRTMSLGGTTNTWASTSAPPAGYAVPGMGRSFYLGMNVKF
jgi:iron complex outermembrane receptor protein